jgi:hypothetical protein
MQRHLCYLWECVSVFLCLRVVCLGKKLLHCALAFTVLWSTAVHLVMPFTVDGVVRACFSFKQRRTSWFSTCLLSSHSEHIFSTGLSANMSRLSTLLSSVIQWDSLQQSAWSCSSCQSLLFSSFMMVSFCQRPVGERDTGNWDEVASCCSAFHCLDDLPFPNLTHGDPFFVFLPMTIQLSMNAQHPFIWGFT